MLVIESDNYQFPVVIHEDYETNSMIIGIGNNKCKPQPCMIIEVDRRDWSAVIQTIDYYKKCSISEKEFERGKGGIHTMVKVGLKWLLITFPKIKKVFLTDKSYYQKILIPERKVIFEGLTWYAKYFGAKPADPVTKTVLKKLTAIHNNTDARQHLMSLHDSAWTYENIGDTLKPYMSHGQLTGSTWVISKNTINSYPEQYTTFETAMEGGGCNWLKDLEITRSMSIWRRIT